MGNASWILARVILSACVGIGSGTPRDVSAATTAAPPKIVKGNGVNGPKGMVWVPGGEFLMGSDHKLAQRNERPAHRVRVHGFWMDETHVTNAQFARFVKSSGYVTLSLIHI